MLTDRERTALEHEIARYPNRRAASVDCLVRLQESRGWLSEESLMDLAPLLGMSVQELDALATFYNRLFRRPVGRHVVTYCNSVSCWIMGCERLRERLESHLGVCVGGTTRDGRFTLLPTQCLGACNRAPVMAVDDEQHGDLEPERDHWDLAAIFDRYA